MTDQPDIDLRGQEPAPEVPPAPETAGPAEPMEPAERAIEDPIDDASDDSFPASDPPSFSGTSSTQEPPPKSF